LLPLPKRKNNAHRFYTQEDSELLKIIICLKRTGMSLEEIKPFLSMPYNEEIQAVPEMYSMLLEHKRRIERQLENLQQILDLINTKLMNGEKLGPPEG
jgi:MerR family copper efflux transcriptional regulator